jgi:hypothetical protein
MHELMDVHSVAVNSCVIESFPEGHFDRLFLAGNSMRSFDKSHQPLH